MSDRQLSIHGPRLLRLIDVLGDTRRITQVQMADELGLAPSTISVVIRSADYSGLVELSGNRRRRQITLTERGRAFVDQSSPDQPADLEAVRPLPVGQWQRVLLCTLGNGQSQRRIRTLARLTIRELHYVLGQLRDRGMIYRAHDGERCSPAGSDWLRSRGVQLTGPKKQRICLMCREPAADDRWYCEQHLIARHQMIATQNDGTYIAAGGQL